VVDMVPLPSSLLRSSATESVPRVHCVMQAFVHQEHDCYWFRHPRDDRRKSRKELLVCMTYLLK